MKKRLGRLAVAVTALAMLVTAFGCKNPDATAETKQYTVTFETNGGSSIDAVKVTDGDTLTLPDDPAKAGYDFAGWYSDTELTAEFDAAAAVTESVTLYAKWTATEYTITYVLNDDNATNSPDNPSKYTIESEDIVFEDASTTGTAKPHFAGWFSDEGLETVATGIPKGSTGSVTVYAAWSGVRQYTVTFYKGTAKLGSVKVSEGAKVSVPSDIAVEGYTIEGW